jgi:hypothetical protein
VTPKKSNSNTNTNAKSRFNPTFPFTSSKHAATDTPETVGMVATPDTTDDSDDGGDEHEHVTCTIPAANIRMIQAAYGENANLYTQVLQVETEFAKEQEIRIAYFRRGRQVLAQQQQEKQQLQQGDTSLVHCDVPVGNSASSRQHGLRDSTTFQQTALRSSGTQAIAQVRAGIR